MTGYQFRKPCLDCGTLTSGATRCETCAAAHARAVDAKRDKSKRTLYSADYKKRAKAVRDQAEICWVCGGGYIPDDPWQADHVVADDPASPLAAAHRSCNIKRALQQRTQK